MKRTLVLTLCLLMTMSIMAIKAIHKPVTYRQSDGTTIAVYREGDGHAAFYTTLDGKVLTKNSHGDLCYARLKDGTLLPSELIAHDAQLRDRQETAWLDSVNLSPRNPQLLRLAMNRRRATSSSTADGLGKYGTSGAGAVNTIGSYTFPVIMVQFADTKFQSTTTVARMNRYYNEEGYTDAYGSVGSVRDYFVAQSYGKFVPTFDIVGIVTLSKNHSAYGANDSNGSDVDVNGMVSDAIAAAVSQLGTDFSKYVSGNGVPLVCILYAGEGEATNGGDDTVWPCEYDWQTTASGTYFRSYFVGNELYGNNLMGIGTFCHEFGHAAGLPDWYCTDYSYSGDDPYGDWSIMDTGAYVGNSYAPVGYTALERSMLGWLDIPEVGKAADATGKVTLADPTSFGVSAVKITTTDSKQNFILENRQQGTWYSKSSGGTSYGSGLMLTRVVYDADYWNYDIVNNTQSKKRSMMITADGRKLYYYQNVSQANLYGNGVNGIGNLTLFDGTKQDAKISSVTKNGDRTISFVYSGAVEAPDSVVVSPDGYLFKETFDQCTGSGGNDGKGFGGSVATSEKKFVPDVLGWSASKSYGGSQCARFNSNSSHGPVTSPTFVLDGGADTLTFKAAPWSTDGTTLTVSLQGVDGGQAEIIDGDSTLTMTANQWTAGSLIIKGTGKVKLVFTPAKRFWLDDVGVKADTTTGIATIRADKRHPDNRIYTLAGQYVGTDLSHLPAGIYISGGKKWVVR